MADALTIAKSRIDALACHFGNRDDVTAPEVARNLVNGNAAFWHSSGSGNDALGMFVGYAAEHQDVVRGIHAWENDFKRPSQMWREDLLDRVLPLNSAAVASLQNAYVDIGTFRTAAELIARTAKAEDAALDVEVAA